MTIERPFEYLRRLEDGENFAPAIVNKWYEARAYVLDELKDITFTPTSDAYLNAVVLGDSSAMLSVVRQIALSAHYMNHDEECEDEEDRRRTVITIVSSHVSDMRHQLEREEYLCNLPKYCKYVDADGHVSNRDSYIDIEIRIVRDVNEIAEAPGGTTVVFSDEKMLSFCQSAGDAVYSIDTRKAIYAGCMYGLGADIDNLPAEDIHCTARYIMALNTFQHVRLNDELKPLFSNDKIDGLIEVRETLSNIFCADCFESRERAIDIIDSERQRKKKSVFALNSSASRQKIWELNNACLSRSEHSRWVVEKLIMGYSPLSREQQYRDEILSYDMGLRKQYRKRLKRDPHRPAHIDICSYGALRRIDPDAMKYDSFLMLGIPIILAKLRKK